MIKTIKIKEKMGFIFAQDPRGCDVAHKATWQSHANPHEHMRGAEVTCALFIYTRII